MYALPYRGLVGFVWIIRDHARSYVQEDYAVPKSEGFLFCFAKNVSNKNSLAEMAAAVDIDILRSSEVYEYNVLSEE